MTPARIFEKIHTTYSRYVYLPNLWLLSLLCGWHIANRIRGGPPVWLALVGPSGSGKTLFTKPFNALDNVTALSQITPRTFASGLQSRKTRTSLLEKLSDRRDENATWIADDPRFLIFPDFANVFSLPVFSRNEILSQLRMIYDGRFLAEWGSGKSFTWEGRMGVIVCSTPGWDHEVAKHRTLGERFLVWRTQETISEGGMRQVRNLDESLAIPEISEAVMLLDTLEVPEYYQLPATWPAWIQKIAHMTAILRTEIPRGWRGQVVDRPTPESPTRLIRQFTQLARGLGLLHENSTDAVKFPLVRLAANCIPALRADILRVLVEPMSSPEVARQLHMPDKSIVSHLTDLAMLQVTERLSTKIIKLKDEWQDYARVIRLVHEEQAGTADYQEGLPWDANLNLL